MYLMCFCICFESTEQARNIKLHIMTAEWRPGFLYGPEWWPKRCPGITRDSLLTALGVQHELCPGVVLWITRMLTVHWFFTMAICMQCIHVHGIRCNCIQCLGCIHCVQCVHCVRCVHRTQSAQYIHCGQYIVYNVHTVYIVYDIYNVYCTLYTAYTLHIMFIWKPCK